MRLGRGREKKGQFIIIAALMMAIMIISISSIIYSAVTYFKHERWEEYVVLIDSIKTGTSRVVEISLANYTQTLTNTILSSNLDRWSNDVKQAYAGFGVILTYTLRQGTVQAYGVSINYNIGLNYTWYKSTSFSAANTSASLSLASAGLTGYNFTSSAFLKETILAAKYYDSANPKYLSKYLSIYLSIEKEDLIPITNLKKDNFALKVDGSDVPSADLSFSRYFSGTYSMFIYEIRYSVTSKPTGVSVTATDTRSIRVIANSTVI